MSTHWIDTEKYKDILNEVLIYAKQQGATQAQVGAYFTKGLNVNVRLGDIEQLVFNQDKAVGLSVYVGQRKGAASTTDFSIKALNAMVDAALTNARYTEPDECVGLADRDQMATQIVDLNLHHPWELSVEQAKNMALACEDAGRQQAKITNSEGASVSTAQNFQLLANTQGFSEGYFSSVHSVACTLIADQQRDYYYTLARDAAQLESPEAVGSLAAQRVIARLNPQKIVTQRTPVIFHWRVAASLIKHFLGAISGDAIYKDASFLIGSIEQPIFYPKISLYERVHVRGGLASLPFDSEGVGIIDRSIIDQGVLKNYLLNSYTARKLKMHNTGHAGGVRNVYLHADESLSMDLAQLLKTMDKGLLITELMGQGVNTVTGDYSRGASGFWVEHGVIQYPVHELTIAGHLKQMFMGIVGVGQEVDPYASIQSGSLLIDGMMVAGS